MGRITISNLSTEKGVTLKTNVANEYSPILELKAPASMVYILNDKVPLRMRLNAAGPTELGADTDIVIATQRPNEVIATQKCRIPYRVFKNITDADQLNVNTEPRRAINIPEGRLVIPEDSKLVILAKATAVVSWAVSYLELEIDEIVKPA
jgi:hypothetical protein